TLCASSTSGESASFSVSRFSRTCSSAYVSLLLLIGAIIFLLLSVWCYCDRKSVDNFFGSGVVSDKPRLNAQKSNLRANTGSIRSLQRSGFVVQVIPGFRHL